MVCKHKMWLISWVWLTSLLVPSPVFAAKLALVIGNDNYQNIQRLEKAVADAKGYADVLHAKGFEVHDGYNLSHEQINVAVADFIDQMKTGDTAVFVYSGHGWSDGTRNYIIGVDAPASAGKEKLRAFSKP